METRVTTAPHARLGVPQQANRPHSNKRAMWGTVSNPASKFTLNFGPKFGDVKNDMLMGSKNVVCQTRAENKANKLNRSEQLKLQSYENRLMKEHRLNNRLYRQKETAFRIRSASVLKGNPTDLNIKRLEKRAQSAAPTAHKQPRDRGHTTAADDSGTECAMCAQIETLMKTYKDDCQPTTLPEEVPHVADHSKCMLTDSQAKTFLQILESKYFREMSDLRAKVRETDAYTPALNKHTKNTHQISMEEIEYRNSSRVIGNKIKEFCITMDRFNKEHDFVPESVKHEFETSRIANAIVQIERPIIETPSRQKILRHKAEKLLDLR